MSTMYFRLLSLLMRVGRRNLAFKLYRQWSEPFTRPSQYRAALMFASKQQTYPLCEGCGWIVFPGLTHTCSGVAANELLVEDEDVRNFALRTMTNTSEDLDLDGDYTQAYAMWTESLCNSQECMNKAEVDGFCLDHYLLGRSIRV